jgi:hypothetical protein
MATIARSSHSNTGPLQISPHPKSLSSFVLQAPQTCGPTMLSSSQLKCAISSGFKTKIWTMLLRTWTNRHIQITGLISGPNCKPGARIVQQSSLKSTFVKMTPSLIAHPSHSFYMLLLVPSHRTNYITLHACCYWISSRQVLICHVQVQSTLIFGTPAEFVVFQRQTNIMVA